MKSGHTLEMERMAITSDYHDHSLNKKCLAIVAKKTVNVIPGKGMKRCIFG